MPTDSEDEMEVLGPTEKRSAYKNDRRELWTEPRVKFLRSDWKRFKQLALEEGVTASHLLRRLVKKEIEED